MMTPIETGSAIADIVDKMDTSGNAIVCVYDRDMLATSVTVKAYDIEDVIVMIHALVTRYCAWKEMGDEGAELVYSSLMEILMKEKNGGPRLIPNRTQQEKRTLT